MLYFSGAKFHLPPPLTMTHSQMVESYQFWTNHLQILQHGSVRWYYGHKQNRCYYTVREQELQCQHKMCYFNTCTILNLRTCMSIKKNKKP